VTTQRMVCRTTAAKGGNGADASAVITTNAIDRDGDQIDPAGLDIARYMQNPVVLFAHDYQALPVGRCVSLNRNGNQWRATWTWLQQDEFADRVANAWRQQVLGACSIGFRPIQSQPRPDGNGRLFTQAELLEFSIVPVPSNQEALRALKAFGLVSKSGRVLSAASLQRVNDAVEACSASDASMMLARHHLKNALEHCRTLRESAGPTDEGDETDAMGIEDDDDAHNKSVLDVDDDDGTIVLDLDDVDPLIDRARHDTFDISRAELKAVLPTIFKKAVRGALDEIVAREVEAAFARARGRVD
jgi:HK97 family phage prohead protease